MLIALEMLFVMSINVVCVQHQTLEMIVDIHVKVYHVVQIQIAWSSIKKLNACVLPVLLAQLIELVVVLMMMNASTRRLFVQKVHFVWIHPEVFHVNVRAESVVTHSEEVVHDRTSFWPVMKNILAEKMKIVLLMLMSERMFAFVNKVLHEM